jgi:hypothetical protein
MVASTVRLGIDLGAYAGAITYLAAFVDGNWLAGSVAVDNPCQSVAEIEIDTKYLADGQHAVFVEAFNGQAVGGCSPAITINTTNPLRYPNWPTWAEAGVDIDLQFAPAIRTFSLYFFNALYPKAYSACPVYQYDGTTTDGTVNYSEQMTVLGIGGPASDPAMYVFADASPLVGTPHPLTMPPIGQSSFPDEGLWAVAYADDYVDYNAVDKPDSYVLDPHTADNSEAPSWCHTIKLGSWINCGNLQSDGAHPTLGVTADQNPDGTFGQSLPMRINRPPYGKGSGAIGDAFPRDRDSVLGTLARPDVVNFFGAGHGLGERFLGMQKGSYALWIKHRYRFAFLDGCQTGTDELLKLWGADRRELEQPDFVTESFYKDPTKYNKLRPGAFLGFLSDTQITYPMGGKLYDDPYTGHRSCYWRQFETYCNWHNQLVDTWANNGKTLAASIDYANLNADKVLGSYPTWSPDPPPGWTFKVNMPGGAEKVYFNPATCLRRVGMGDLKFRAYNLGTDWPPPPH